MTQDQAATYNLAIQHALEKYSQGRGAIASLKIPFSVTVDHVGLSTKQEVVYGND